MDDAIAANARVLLILDFSRGSLNGMAKGGFQEALGRIAGWFYCASRSNGPTRVFVRAEAIKLRLKTTPSKEELAYPPFKGSQFDYSAG
jgi:hypothetical protein